LRALNERPAAHTIILSPYLINIIYYLLNNI